MARKNDFEVIVPSNDDVENMISEHAKILDSNNVLNRLNNLGREHNTAYSNLVLWVYDTFKSTVPCSDSEQIDKLPLMCVLKRLPSSKFDIFLDMLKHYEKIVEFNNSHGIVTDEKPTVPVPEYISFTIARYALTDVIEELNNSGAKEIIVTKEDGNLIVKYKPYWKA